jgi:Kef-type K+ transport system membrane component KefB
MSFWRHELDEIQENKRSVVFVILVGPVVFLGLAIYYLFPSGVNAAIIMAGIIAWGGIVVLKLLNDKQKYFEKMDNEWRIL